MAHPSAASGAFAQPFPEQIAFFRQKLGNLIPTQRWDDIEAQEHDTGFMVAGAATADLLTDFVAATDKFISQGRGIEEFRKDFRSIVAANGWTGWTGEGSVRGEAWRVGVIYRTNAYTSYSAGRHAQLLDGNFKYWIYRHGDSRDPRIQHLAWDGLALPPGHEFWISHYPPSAWGCSCYAVGASSDRMVARLGGDLSKALPDNWRAIDPKTGQMQGIGKGWGYAPCECGPGRQCGGGQDRIMGLSHRQGLHGYGARGKSRCPGARLSRFADHGRRCAPLCKADLGRPRKARAGPDAGHADQSAGLCRECGGPVEGRWLRLLAFA
jgi:hypothetical protein